MPLRALFHHRNVHNRLLGNKTSADGHGTTVLLVAPNNAKIRMEGWSPPSGIEQWFLLFPRKLSGDNEQNGEKSGSDDEAVASIPFLLPTSVSLSSAVDVDEW